MAITKVTRNLLNTGVSDSSDATAITIDSNENVGIGVVPSSTIRNDISTAEKALQIGNRAMLFSDGGATTDLQNNSHLNNSDQRVAMQTDAGSLYQQYQGVHKWFNAASVSAGSVQTMNERMRLDSAGDLKFNSGFGSVATAYGVRAWVRFRGDTSGTGNRQVNGSGNVSSVGYIAAGRYRVNFSNNMPDVYYAVSATAIGVSNHNPQSASIDINNSNSVSYIDVAYGPSGGANSVSIANNSGAEYNAIIVR